MSNSSDVVSDHMVRTEDRRSLWVVDPKFQRRYAMILLSIVALVSVVLIGAFMFHSRQVMQTLENAGVVKTHSLYLIIADQMKSLLISVTVVTVLFGTFVTVAASMLSHRIVGPIFAIKRSLEALISGRTNEARITLRDTDEFKEVG